MSPDPAFPQVMAGLQAGDQEAAAAVFRRFAHRLIGLARQRLAPVIRPHVDPEDVVQSVFRSFIRCHCPGTETFAHWNDLWRRLAVITVRKCAKKSARALRDLDVVHPADPQTIVPVLGREPTPEEAAVLADLVTNLMRRLRPSDRLVLTLRLQGHGTGEISDQLGCSERRVQRALDRIRERLDRLLG